MERRRQGRSKEGKRERATEAKRGKEGGRGKEIKRERCKGEREQWVINYRKNEGKRDRGKEGTTAEGKDERRKEGKR